MTGNGMTEEELGRRHRALLVEIIEKATSEPAWKQKLMSDPQAAFDEAGLLPEIDALNPASLENVEVGGQMTSSSYVRTLLLCSFYKCSWPY